MPHNYTAEEFNNVLQWINASLKLLIAKDEDLLKPESIQTKYKIEGKKDLNREIHETTINHRLSHYMENLIDKYEIKGYHVDIEYNRYINNQKLVMSLETGDFIEVRPDIIVHKRTRLYEPEPHFLVVEAKKYKLSDKDRNHVKDIMFDINYRYKYGMLISYYDNPDKIQYTLITLPTDSFFENEYKIKK